MTVHLQVKTLAEQRAAVRDIMGQPTYSWYITGVSDDIPPADGREIILPIGISKIHTNDRNSHQNIYLRVWEFYRGSWSEVDWSMRSWSFQTIANFNEENPL